MLCLFCLKSLKLQGCFLVIMLNRNTVGVETRRNCNFLMHNFYVSYFHMSNHLWLNGRIYQIFSFYVSKNILPWFSKYIFCHVQNSRMMGFFLHYFKDFTPVSITFIVSHKKSCYPLFFYAWYLFFLWLFLRFFSFILT